MNQPDRSAMERTSGPSRNPGEFNSGRESVAKQPPANSRTDVSRNGESEAALQSRESDTASALLGEGTGPNKTSKRKRRRKRGKRRGAENKTQAQQQAVPQVQVSKPAPVSTPSQLTEKSEVSPRPVPQQSSAYAALDLGTNNCRLLVAVPTRPGQFRVVDAFSRIVRLGEGLGATGRLSQGAMDRAVEALKICSDKLNTRQVRKHRLIATEACRSAENGPEFLERVFEETGLRLDIVDRETEARLAVSGCASLVDQSAKSIVLFDIGGGSSEIALIDVSGHRGGRLSDRIIAWTSLPVGVVTMAERFGGQHVTPEMFDEMTAYALQLLNDNGSDRLLASTGPSEGLHLIGTSGTVTTLAGIQLGLPRYDRRRVDGLWMESAEVDRINAQLLSWSFDERVANPCIGADRADLVLAGCAILAAIRRAWPAERLRVADRGLREGLLTEMMSADGVWRRRRPSRYRAGNKR